VTPGSKVKLKDIDPGFKDRHESHNEAIEEIEQDRKKRFNRQTKKSGGSTMSQDIAKQTEVENGLLNLLIEGLRSTIAWRVEGNDFSRKLSTLRFIVRSFQGHLERLFALEEYDGYMDLVNKRAARLSRTADALKLEHDQFRIGIRRIAQGLERISPMDQVNFAARCDELLALLERLCEHGKQEIDLIQEAFEQDRGGGEG